MITLLNNKVKLLLKCLKFSANIVEFYFTFWNTIIFQVTVKDLFYEIFILHFNIILQFLFKDFIQFQIIIDILFSERWLLCQSFLTYCTQTINILANNNYKFELVLARVKSTLICLTVWTIALKERKSTVLFLNTWYYKCWIRDARCQINIDVNIDAKSSMFNKNRKKNIKVSQHRFSFAHTILNK